MHMFQLRYRADRLFAKSKKTFETYLAFKDIKALERQTILCPDTNPVIMKTWQQHPFEFYNNNKKKWDELEDDFPEFIGYMRYINNPTLNTQQQLQIAQQFKNIKNYHSIYHIFQKALNIIHPFYYKYAFGPYSLLRHQKMTDWRENTQILQINDTTKIKWVIIQYK